MACNIRRDGDGRITAFICGRPKPKRCVTCGAPSQVLCDYPVKRDGKDATCDRPCCRKHSKTVGPDCDYCLAHANFEETNNDASKTR